MADIIVPMYTLLDTTRAHDFSMQEEEFLSLVETFEKSLLEERKALLDAAQARDQEELHRTLHTLKGYLPFLCQASFCEQITELDQMVRGNQLDLVVQGVMSIMPHLDVLHAEIVQWQSSYHSKKG
ncbi:MAG: hypothetical protein EXR35_11145 [Limnohabitans sp.]|nr:hypothetical protein [Limnohabitans sp.]